MRRKRVMVKKTIQELVEAAKRTPGKSATKFDRRAFRQKEIKVLSKEREISKDAIIERLKNRVIHSNIENPLARPNVKQALQRIEFGWIEKK